MIVATYRRVVTQPLQVGLRVAELVLKLHREGARRLTAPGGPPVDQLCFWDGEGDVDWGGHPFQRGERFLKEADIRSVAGGGHCDSKVINVGDGERSGRLQVEGRDVYDEEQGGDE